MYERRFRESTQPGMKTRRECKMTKMVYRKTCDQILYALLSQISFDHRWPKRNMRACMGKIEFET